MLDEVKEKLYFQSMFFMKLFYLLKSYNSNQIR